MGFPTAPGMARHTAKPDPGALNIPKVEAAPVKPAMSRAEIEAGLKSHDRALYIKQGWIRDPYITLGPDDFFYLTGTTPNPKDPREQTDPYNVGLGGGSVVGTTVQVWRSKDLIDWEYLGTPFTFATRQLAQTTGRPLVGAGTALGSRNETLGARPLSRPEGQPRFIRWPGLERAVVASDGRATRPQARPFAFPGRRHLVAAFGEHADGPPLAADFTEFAAAPDAH